MGALSNDLEHYFNYAKQSLVVSESGIIVSDDILNRLRLLSPTFKEKCRHITQRRLILNSEESLRDVKKLRTDGSARLYTSVKEFWKLVSSHLDIIVASFTDDLFKVLGLDREDTPDIQYEKYLKFHKALRDIISNLKSLVVGISVVAEYSFLNYPKLMRNICKQNSAMDYTFYTFTYHIKERLGDKLGDVLKCAYDALTGDVINQQLSQVGAQYSLFSLLSCYRLDVSEGYPIDQFLADRINADIGTLKTSDIDDNFFVSVFVGIRKELLLKKLCHIEYGRFNQYLQLFLNEGVFLRILHYMLEKYERRLETADEDVKVQNDDIHYMLKKFYDNNGNGDMYYSYITKFIQQKLRATGDLKSSLDNIFVLATNLSILFYFDKRALKIIMNELCLRFSGSLHMYESFERLLEMKIRKYNRSHEKAVESGFSYKFRDDLLKNKFHDRCLFILPNVLGFESSFLKLHQQKLFRRAVMRGPDIYRTISDFSYLEMNVLYGLISLYEKTDEMHALYDLYLSLRKSYLFLQDYRKKEGPQVVPLIIDKRNVPASFQKETNEDLILPQELQVQWQRLHKFFLDNATSADAKSLVPMYSLQHCDVETPFVLDNKRRLVMNLSIYQTCILYLFNDEDVVNLDTICAKTGLRTETAAQVVQSFEAAKLVVKSSSGYHLNAEFKPDLKRVKDGKLRIPMVQRQSYLTSSASTASTSTSTSMPTAGSHSEGYSSLWRQELLKAAIVRSLKAAGQELSQDQLASSLTLGASAGEFKDALHRLSSDRVIRSTKNGYQY